MKTKKCTIRLFCICLVLILISCIGASALQTDFGKVRVERFNIPTDSGQWVTGLLFAPANASVDSKVPLVITSHGYLNNAQMQDSSCIEMSRRGIAVIAIDAYNHGDSSGTKYNDQDSGTYEGRGLIPLVEYAYNCLEWVDNTKIGITGHSMGGTSTWNVARYYGRQYLAAIEAAQSPESDGGEEITEAEEAAARALNKVAAAFPVSQMKRTTEDAMAEIVCNFGENFGKYDEGSYKLANGDGDLTDAPESLVLINSVLPEGEKLTDTVELGKMYGDASNGTLRVVYNPPETHPWQPFTTASAGYMTEFFLAAFEMDNPIPLSNQVWLLKELFNFLGMIALFIIIFPMTTLLLEVPVFASLKTAIPEALPAPQGSKGKAVFWGGWALSWIISWLSFLPVAQLDQHIFPDAYNKVANIWFPQPTTNQIMLWAVFNGIVGIVLFVATYKIYGKKNGVTPEMWGIKTNVREFIKTLALAACIFVGVYALVGFADYFFTTDYRLYTIAFRHFTPDKLLYALMYWPLFFIFFAGNSIAINSSSRIKGMSDGLNTFICGIGNILGVAIILGVQYFTLFTTGTAFWPEEWLVIVPIIPMLIMLFVAAYINRYLFNKTGKVWLGALVNTLIMVMMCVANGASYVPV